MRTPKEIKDLIKDNLGELANLIENEGYDEESDSNLEEFLGMPFKFIDSKRDNEYMRYHFSLDGQVFETWTNYDSWQGPDDIDLCDMMPVRLTEKVVKIWETMPWE